MKMPGLAIIGLGPAALPHAKSLVDLQDKVDVIWAASGTKERTEEFSKSFPFPVTERCRCCHRRPCCGHCAGVDTGQCPP